MVPFRLFHGTCMHAHLKPAQIEALSTRSMPVIGSGPLLAESARPCRSSRSTDLHAERARRQ